MPRSPAPEQQAEYARMRDFTLALAGVIDELVRAAPAARAGVPGPDGTPNEYDVPSQDLNLRAGLAERLKAREERSFAQARAGCRTALRDLLEATRSYPPGLVRSVDERFASRGLATLSQMRREVWQTIPKVLARGRIRTDEEYYLLVERLNDLSGDDLSPEQREDAGRLVAEYEARKADPRRRRR